MNKNLIYLFYIILFINIIQYEEVSAKGILSKNNCNCPNNAICCPDPILVGQIDPLGKGPPSTG